MTYQEKKKTYEALQYDGTNAEELVAFAPSVLFIEDGKLFFTTTDDLGRYEVQQTEWVVEYIGYWNIIIDTNFQQLYEPATALL